MKTRWSLSFLPLWNSANKISSHVSSSSSQGQSHGFPRVPLWSSLAVMLFCLVTPCVSGPLTSPFHFLYQRAYARNIRPQPCQTKGGDTGVCMFAWDCMKANGTHLGTCIDRFYFGSCCKLDSKKRPIKPCNQEESNDICDDDLSDPVIVKPSPSNTDKPDKHNNGDIGMVKPDTPSMTGLGMNTGDNDDMTGMGTNTSDEDEVFGMETNTSDEDEVFGMGTNTDYKDDMTVTGTNTDDKVVVTDMGTNTDEKDDMTDMGTNTTDKDHMTVMGTNTTDKGVMTGMGTDSTNKDHMTGMGTHTTDKDDMTGMGTDTTDKDGMIDMGTHTTDKDDMTGMGTDTIDKDGMTDMGTHTIDKSDVTGMGTDTIDKDDMTGMGTNTTDKDDMAGIGTNTADKDDVTDMGTNTADKDDVTGMGTIKPDTLNMTEVLVLNETNIDKTGSKPHEGDIMHIGNSNIEGDDISYPMLSDSDMIQPAITVSGMNESEKDKPDKVEIEIQVSGAENMTVSNILIDIDTATGATGIDMKPIEGAIEDDESGSDNDSDISITTELPVIYVDNLPVIDVIGEGEVVGDSAIIDDSDNSVVSPDETNNNPFNEITNEPLIIEPATSSRPPSTDNPFDDIDKETLPPQEPITTFSPVKQTSDQSIAATVIPSAGKPIKLNGDKTDNDNTDDYIELTTFFPSVTDNIADPATIEDKTDDIFTDIGNSPTDPSVITLKPKPAVSKPGISGIDSITEISTMPEETTIFPGIGSPLPSFPGINVIPATIISTGKPDVGDSIKLTDKPAIEETTETHIPEPSTDKVTVDKLPDIIIISTTTESEKPVDPITNIPVVSIKPTKPEAPVTDDPTDWVPIVFPGPITEMPKPTEKPIETSTDNIDTQVKPHKQEDDEEGEDDDIEVAASTTIDTILDQNDILAQRLNGSKYSEICGRPVYPTKRIVGGSDASFGEFPWQVSLRQWRSVTFLHKCGAALLNENWAVTAAHCVENVQPEQLLLRLGEFDLETAAEPYGFVERKVQIIATHPQFDARTFEYDLALLRFYEPIDFQPNVIPICIPQDDYNFIGDTGFVSGWGRLYEDGPLPSIMQKVPVPVITNPECEAMYKVAGYVEHIPQIFICAGYEAGLKDSCEGDSGGPMVIQRDGVWNLAGVISWGIGCALPNQPGVYTRISAFREWIEKIIVF